jgi:predicted unusual protein kinase regulating ubiquinone biosynthesis (AarF/ABC1/UbiB family)
MKTSRLGRLGKLVGVGGRMIGQSISSTILSKSSLQTRVDQAKLLAQTLGELKGASMKFGQMLSIQGEHLLPPEVAEVLSKLQDSVPAFSSEKILKILQDELGDKMTNLRFYPEPIAAASIGQVHRIDLMSGDRVQSKLVVKVQYPGIDLAVNSEVAVLRKVLQLFSKVYVGELEVDPLIEEIRALLLQEVDYEREGRFLKFFSESLEGDKRFIVPQYLPEFSTKRILCMSEEAGLSFKKYVSSSAPDSEKKEIGKSLFELYLKEVYTLRTVQTDPNFGNYLIKKDHGVAQVVLLDFGATKVYSEEMIRNYKRFVLALLEKDRPLAMDIADQMGLLSRDESDEVKDLFYQMGLLSVEPVMMYAGFEFGTSDLPQRLHKIGLQFLRKVRKTSPPKDFIFLNRKVGGIYNLLRSLGVNESLRPLLDSYLKID